MRFLVQRLSVCLAVALLFASALGAEQSDRSKTVTRLNNEILRVYSRSVRGGGDTSALRQQAQELLQEREEALAALVDESPDAALDSALPPEVASEVARAFPESAARVERHGSLIGVLEIEVEDDENLVNHRMIHRLRVGRDRFRMRFSGDAPTAEAGSLMRVDGMLVGESIVTQSASLTTEADAAASCSSTGAQRMAVIKVKFPGTSPSLSNSTLAGWMFGSSGTTVSSYWDEASYGAAWATGDVYPSGSDAWYTLDREYLCSESDALRNAALQAANGDVNFQNYQRAVIVFPKPSNGCSFAGRASIGCWVGSPDGNSISYALQVLSSMGTAEKTVQLTTHEGGHTLGLYHASTVDYGSDAVGPTNSNGTRDEYGDRYSSMGFWTNGHYAAPQKKQLGWLNPTSVSSSGTYTVKPFSDTSGVRALDIKRGSSGSQRIWLEYRRQLGQFNAGPPSYPGNGALLHLGNGNSNSLLLDFTPTSSGGFMDATLESGQTWNDPYSDLSIQIGSATNSGLQVTVSYGVTPTCSTNPPTINVSPNSKSTDYPAPASYSVTVTNNDSSACSSSSFTMSSKALYNSATTSEVSTYLNNGVLTIAPGATGTTTLVATPSIQPPDARNYMVSAKASRTSPNQSAEDEAGLTVVPPLQCVTAAPIISLSPNSRTAEFPAGTTFTASVTNNDNSSCSATSFSMTASALLNGQPAGNISANIASTLSVAPGTTKTTTVTVTPTSAPASDSIYSIIAKAARSNPSQTVQDSSNFTVTVAPVCEAALPTVSLSPTSRSTEYPNAASYTLTVVNNDSSVCSTSSFSIGATATGAANASPANAALSIAPGATATTTITATPTSLPTSTTNHTIAANVSRSNPSQLVQDTSVLTVTPPAPTCQVALPTVSISPSNRNTEYPNAAVYTLTILNNDSSACSAGSFSIGASATGAASASTFNTALSIAPGATQTTILTATPTSLPSSPTVHTITGSVSRSNPSQLVQSTTQLTVTPPAATCQTAPPSVTLSPISQSSVYPNGASYSLTVVNNDSSVCDPSSFSVLASATGEVSAQALNPILNIAPGATQTTTVTATPTALPSSPTDYTVAARVSRSNPSELVLDTSVLTVSPPAPTCVVALPTITVNPANGTTEYPNPVSYTVSLTNNDSAACQASTFSLTSDTLFGGLPTTEVSATLGNSGLTVAPGGTGMTVIVATPLVLPTQPKAYAVAAAASRVSQVGVAQGTVGLTVTPPPTGPPPPPPPSTTVDVVISVIGSRGSVDLDPLGISCPGGCTTTIDVNQWEPLTLTAVPSGNSCVQAITGCDASSGNSCTLSAAQNYEITVEFGRCTSVGGKTGGKGRVSRVATTTDATSTGRGRKR